MYKYMKVMFGTISGANNNINYKIDEENVADNWNPNSPDPKEMGGFNFSTEDKILRWLIRGDTIYDVEIPKDAEVIDCPSVSAPHGVFRSNKIILHNPRIMTDEIALDLYKKSNLPDLSYYKSLAGCAIRGYRNTCFAIIKDRVNKNNIDLVLSEIEDFVKPYQGTENDKDSNRVYKEVMQYLNEIKLDLSIKYKEIEKSIIKKFRKDIWSMFIKAVNKYELIQENDRIMVCMSGGKDSFLLAKCMQELQKHGKIHFDVSFVVMDPGYNALNRNKILENAKLLNVPIEMFDTDIFNIVSHLTEGNPCYLCARMRRGHLYNKAQELGCNKIALGHHFDDVIETTLLSMFYASEVKTMLPKLHSENFSGLELIRPLFLVKESAIISWKDYNNLNFINCACRFTENCAITDDGTSKRLQMKKLIQQLRKENKDIDNNLFRSMSNINLNCILGYTKDGKKHSFLDDYE